MSRFEVVKTLKNNAVEVTIHFDDNGFSITPNTSLGLAYDSFPELKKFWVLDKANAEGVPFALRSIIKYYFVNNQLNVDNLSGLGMYISDIAKISSAKNVLMLQRYRSASECLRQKISDYANIGMTNEEHLMDVVIEKRCASKIASLEKKLKIANDRCDKLFDHIMSSFDIYFENVLKPRYRQNADEFIQFINTL